MQKDSLTVWFITMRSNGINILLYGIDGTQTLPIAKSLYKSGYRLIGTYHNKLSYGVHSRYIHEKIQLDATKEEELLSKLIEIIKSKNISVVIPFGDSYAEFLSKNKDVLSQYVRMTVPDYDVFMAAYDKNQLMNLCRAKGYPHPITIDLSNVTDEKELTDFPYPALIKPNITTGGRGMTLVHSYKEYASKISEIKANYGDCHLQQFIPEGGRQIKVQIFVDRHSNTPIGSVIWKQRYYPEKGGSSSCNVTIDSPDLINLCYSVLTDLSWEGFADFDLIEDPGDGQLKIMEINPRFPACLKSAVESGIDYANIYTDYTLGKRVKTYKYQPGAKLRHIGFEILWFISSKNRFKTKPNWFNWFSPRTSFQDFSWDDPFPFIYGTWGNIKKLFGSNLLKEKSGI